jgi:hypothetical protein
MREMTGADIGLAPRPMNLEDVFMHYYDCSLIAKSCHGYGHWTFGDNSQSQSASEPAK